MQTRGNTGKCTLTISIDRVNILLCTLTDCLSRTNHIKNASDSPVAVETCCFYELDTGLDNSYFWVRCYNVGWKTTSLSKWCGNFQINPIQFKAKNMVTSLCIHSHLEFYRFHGSQLKRFNGSNFEVNICFKV